MVEKDLLFVVGVDVDGMHVGVLYTLLQNISIPVAVAILSAEDKLNGRI
jgi:hypothetical protein